MVAMLYHDYDAVGVLVRIFMLRMDPELKYMVH